MSSADTYITSIISNTTLACKWVRLACERHIRDLAGAHERGLYFDEAAADRVIKFIQDLLKHSKGEWAGQPFVLAPWQQFILSSIFGWKREDGARRFRTGYLELGRKGGKTTLLAAMGLYMLVADDEPGAEIYSSATVKDQAKICHGEATNMVRRSPDLKSHIAIFKNSLSVAATNSKFEPVGKDTDTLDGLNVHASLVDELHAHKTREMWDVMETATGARRQPLQFAITTAGFDRTSICWEIHEYTEKILSGSVEDDTFFGVIYTLDEGDRWDDESLWVKANPNLHISNKLDDLQRKAAKAKELPSALNNFLRKHLCVWTQQSDRWIPLDLWDANFYHPITDALFKGRKVYGGLDLSTTKDIAALVWLSDNPEHQGVLDVLCRFWVPESQLTNSTNRYREQYQAWVREGWMYATDGDAVDYQFIRAQVLRDAEQFQVDSINVDRLFQGYQLMMEMAQDGLNVISYTMGIMSVTTPMKELEIRLMKRGVNHGNNPVLRWMADNVAVKVDANENIKPDKPNSSGRIDGIVAMVMALDRVMRGGEKTSKYEEEGVMVI